MFTPNFVCRNGPERIVSAGIIGTGQFASVIIGQSTSIPRLNVQVAADTDVEAARSAFRGAGFDEQDIVISENVKDACSAMARGARVVLPDPLMMMELPVDVVVESTGDAEAGAIHALEAIRHGKHVAMVNKETDSVVGPILKQKADQAGLVYTPVDGDQHGLLIGLVSWAREIGLEVLCGGKFCDAELRFDPHEASLAIRGKTLPVDRNAAQCFARGSAQGSIANLVAERSAVLGERDRIRIHDYEESAIMANATGLAPDTEALHHPTLRLDEIPEALCPIDEGGILRTRGAVDTVRELRDPDMSGMGGGVFVVVACANEDSFRVLRQKGRLPANARGTAALIYRPYHLCGVEATLSVVHAGLSGAPVGAASHGYRPRYTVIGRASRAMSPGEIVQLADMNGGLQRTRPVGDESPIPSSMALGRPLATAVSEGDLITARHVVPPSYSCLWRLRAEQDECFSERADT